ncbi:MAG: MFS transporter, partial [Candidatus Thorarchaeota archaeon]
YYLLGAMAPTINTMISGFYVVFLLRYLTIAEVGILLAFHLLILALLDFPTGSLVDMLGPRKCLMASYGLFFCAYMGLGLVIFIPIMAIPLLFLAELFFAIGIAQESGTLVAWFTNHSKANGGDLRKIRSVYGKAQGISVMATTMAMLVGAFLAEYITVGMAFAGGIILSIIAFAATSLLGSTPPKSLNAKKKYLTFLKEATKVVMDDIRLRSMITASSLNYAGYFIVAALALQPLLYQYLRSFFWLSIIFAVIKVSQVLGSYIGGRIARFLDITTALIIWTAVPFLYLLLFVTILMNWGLYLIVFELVLLFGVFATYNPHVGQFYQRLTPDEHRTAITSLKSTARSMTAILFSIGGGFLLQRFGTEVALLIASGLAFISLGLLYYVWSSSHAFLDSPTGEIVFARPASPVNAPQAS